MKELNKIPRAACYDVPKWHKQQWQERSVNAQEVQASLATGESRVAGFQEFSSEMFHRLISESPNKVQEPKPAAKMREKLHDIASQLPEFEVLRKSVQHDPDWSAIGTAEIIKHLSGNIPANQQVPDVDKNQRMLDSLEAMPEICTPEELASAEGLVAGKAFKLAEQASNLDESSMRVALRKAISEANTILDYTREVGQAFGSNNPKASLELARQVKSSQKLKDIIKLAGRLKLTSRVKRATKSQYARSELVGIETTGKLENLLPSELACFTSELRTLDLIRRLQEKTALGYKLAGKESLKSGPIVVLLDMSGSMQGPKEVWAKAISLAIIDICQRDKRSFALCLFTDHLGLWFLAEDISKLNYSSILTLLAANADGGTEFRPPISWALEVIKSAKKFQNFKKADIVLVTDGEASEEGSVHAKKSMLELGITAYGIRIGSGDSESGALKAWTHEQAYIDDVNQDTKATNLLFEGL